MTSIFLRAFSDNYFVNERRDNEGHNPRIRVVLDTETTIDEYQNLLFGSCLIDDYGFKQWFIFYGDIPDDKVKLLVDYGSKHNIRVLGVREFVDKVFFKYAYRLRGEVIGFNLPFDLSRLSIGFGVSRKTYGAFSLTLSNNPFLPRILIKSVDQKRSFISFLKPFKGKSNYRGYFVDLKTFIFALTDRAHSLDSACKSFGVSRKQHVDEHGHITEEYIEYNLNDVKITAELYDAAIKRYKMFGLGEEPNKLYSPASIGKAYLKSMGVKPFMVLNGDFPRTILGYVMSTYYGGRTEVKIRRKSVPVTYLDFTSMYPTVYTLLELDRFLKAERIGYVESTGRLRGFLSSIRIDDLRSREFWCRDEMHSIVKIRPNMDILPARVDSDGAKNIGINYVSSDTPLWYTVQDVIASIILSGRVPEILEAYTFIPIGRQKVRDVSISGIVIRAEDDFIRQLIEERMRVKKSDRADKDEIQLILKIIANATSYGIYIEETREHLDESIDVMVYSLNSFRFKTDKVEFQGEYFNPIMASLITGSARLILALAERLTLDNNGYFAYCDTDSIFVSPEVKDKIQEFFRPLNPYNEKVEMFKVEVDDSGRPLDNVMFYGVSAKRYCLYTNNEIRKYSTHGLGHLIGVDGRKVWSSILSGDYDEWADKVAVTQLTVSKPSILKRFERFNSGKPISKCIKPFNFVLVGVEVNGVIPCIPFTRDLQFIRYKLFVDYKSGSPSSGLPLPTYAYWRTMDEVIGSYALHDDRKLYYGVDGVAQRKLIYVDRIRYIGKESNNLDENKLGVSQPDYLEYVNNENFKQFALSLKKVEGVSNRGLRNFKLKIKRGENIRNSRIMRTILMLFLRG